ncbi:MAG: hypothetical protein JWM76_1897 [Pseudonocardiales bacterium]|nr:hypothetical protein [Pseudonocardiales bacterium]
MTELSTAGTGGASRRRFLAVAGTGAAAVGVAAAMTPLVSADATPVKNIPVDGALVALVTNTKTNEVTLMHGEREVVVHDKALVALLTNRLAKGV